MVCLFAAELEEPKIGISGKGLNKTKGWKGGKDCPCSPKYQNTQERCPFCSGKCQLSCNQNNAQLFVQRHLSVGSSTLCHGY